MGMIKILSKAKYNTLYKPDPSEYPPLNPQINYQITTCSGTMTPSRKRITNNIKNSPQKC